MTRSLEMPVGKYMLSEFMLVDSMGNVIWATPREGSGLAHLVNKPLPLHFGIGDGTTTSLRIQVIRVLNYSPGDFGYVEFNIGFVERMCLKVFNASRMMDCYGDSILGPDGNWTMPWHQPTLSFFANGRHLLSEPLAAGLNKYLLPVAAETREGLPVSYLLVATNCMGDSINVGTYSLKELMMHRCGDQFEPLVIHPGGEPGVLITPEGMLEPDIRQGIHGFISMDYLDSYMDSTFVPLTVFDLHIFPYHVVDSILTMAPIDCYMSPDLVPWEPLAIVRTNSHGFYQLPLDPGEYYYMVRMENGYYLDAYISSRRPGYVKVLPGELTELIIRLTDCSRWM